MGLLDFPIGDSEKDAQAEAVFSGREPLEDTQLWERYFRQYGVALSTVARVRGVLSVVLETDLSRIRDTDDFSKELAFFWEWDSMADVDAVVGLEKEFGIEISDPEAQAMKSLKDIVLGVHEKVKSRPG